MEEKNKTKDAFTFGVLNSLMESIPAEMAEVLKRTSYHPIFNEGYGAPWCSGTLRQGGY